MRSKLVVLATCVFSLSSASASGWVQTTTCIDEPPEAPTSTPFCTGNEFPVGFAWPTRTVGYRLNQEGSDDFPSPQGPIAPELEAVLRESVETWNEPDCSNFEFEFEGLTEAEYDERDGVNVVVFVEEGWPYQTSAVAITSVTAFTNGEIVNADMELNGQTHNFGFAEQSGATVWDIGNTVTHEAGHMLGLDHTAVDGATMEFDASKGEIDKRTLHPDDIDGLCTIYPVGEDPPNDDPPPDSCCSSVSPSPGSWWLFAVLVAFVARLLHRKLA